MKEGQESIEARLKIMREKLCEGSGDCDEYWDDTVTSIMARWNENVITAEEAKGYFKELINLDSEVVLMSS